MISHRNPEYLQGSSEQEYYSQDLSSDWHTLDNPAYRVQDTCW